MAERNPNALFIGDPGDTTFDEAIVGIGCRCGQPALLVYSYTKLVQVCAKQGASEEEAAEYADFNIVGAWHGEHTPIVMV